MKKAGVSRLIFFKVFKDLRVFKDFKEKTSLLDLIAADMMSAARPNSRRLNVVG